MIITPTKSFWFTIDQVPLNDDLMIAAPPDAEWESAYKKDSNIYADKVRGCIILQAECFNLDWSLTKIWNNAIIKTKKEFKVLSKFQDFDLE